MMLEGNYLYPHLFILLDFSSFKNLEVLDLSWNYFEGCIPPAAIRNLSALVALSLAQNELNGTLPNKGKTKYKNHMFFNLYIYPFSNNNTPVSRIFIMLLN